MRITTKGCYGLHAMLELASAYGGSPVLMRTIAEKHEISRKYLHALLTSLRVSGIVRSVRGSGGGYVLARPPDQIKISEVLRTLEGSLCFAECVDDRQVCRRSGACVGHDLWTELSRMIERHLDRLSLAELASRRAGEAPAESMYFI
jgi:Rrf2 family protein